MARSTSFTPEIGDLICSEIADGKSLRAICAPEDRPALQTIFNWLRTQPLFLEQYARAKEDAADALAEDMLAIADDSEFDLVTRTNEKGNEYQVVDQDHINRARLRVDTRKWIASKLKPKKYGDRIENRLADPDGNALKITVTGIRPTEDNT